MQSATFAPLTQFRICLSDQSVESCLIHHGLHGWTFWKNILSSFIFSIYFFIFSCPNCSLFGEHFFFSSLLSFGQTCIFLFEKQKNWTPLGMNIKIGLKLLPFVFLHPHPLLVFPKRFNYTQIFLFWIQHQNVK